MEIPFEAAGLAILVWIVWMMIGLVVVMVMAATMDVLCGERNTPARFSDAEVGRAVFACVVLWPIFAVLASPLVALALVYSLATGLRVIWRIITKS